MRAVPDCMVFAQALISGRCTSGRCLNLARERRHELVVSDFVLREVRELPAKLPVRFLVAAGKVESFVDGLMRNAILVPDVPSVFVHPVDPDDSPYVDLAIVAGASLIVSRDRHLLGLSNPRVAWSADFRRRFPRLSVVTVEQFLGQLTPALP